MEDEKLRNIGKIRHIDCDKSALAGLILKETGAAGGCEPENTEDGFIHSQSNGEETK